MIAADSAPLPPVCQLHHPQLRAQTLLEPLDALLLRVHDQRPTLAGGQNGCVLNGHPIVWQALVVPGSHGGIICKHEDGIQAVCQGHGGLRQTEGRCQRVLSECRPQFVVVCRSCVRLKVLEPTFWDLRKGIHTLFRSSRRYCLVK